MCIRYDPQGPPKDVRAIPALVESSVNKHPNDPSVSERSGQMAGMLRKLRSLADDEDSARIGELLEAVRTFPLTLVAPYQTFTYPLVPQAAQCNALSR